MNMNMHAYPTYYPNQYVRGIVDHYVLNAISKIDPKMTARMLNVSFNALGQQQAAIALVDQDDKEGIEAYSSEDYRIVTMNGDRPQALQRLVRNEMAQTLPGHLVIISADEAFAPLCALAAHSDTKVSVWTPTTEVPASLLDRRFDNRSLRQLIPDAYVKLGAAAMWLDLENLLISMKKAGFRVNMTDFVQAVRSATSDVGDITTTIAYADFTQLAQDFGQTLQRDLEQLGIRTRYQVSIRGKSSSDMAIASDIHSAFERDPDIQTIIIGTGDRDFRPTVDKAHKCHKKVIVLALENNLSQELKRAADDVIYLDEYFKSKQRTSSVTAKAISLTSEWVDPLMRIAFMCYQHKWAYAFKDNLTNIASPERLQQAVEAGLLKPRRPGDDKALLLDGNHPLAQRIQYFVPWIASRVDYLINTRKMDYADSNYLANGMQGDKQCKELDIGQDRSNAETWLNAAATAGIIVKKQQPHPKTPDKLIDTWWPFDFGKGPPVNESTTKEDKPPKPEPKDWRNTLS